MVELLKAESKDKFTELEKKELFKSPKVVKYNDGTSATEDNSDLISEEKEQKLELKDNSGQ